MADFIFRVDSVQLSEAQQQKIASAIQGAVLTELARLDLHEDQGKSRATPAATGGAIGGSILYRPPSWYGGLLLKAVDFAVATTSHLTVTNAGGEKTKSAA